MNVNTEDFWTGLGIMCVLIGIGGCNYLIDKGEAEKMKAKTIEHKETIEKPKP
jgi:hypothetical protein